MSEINPQSYIAPGSPQGQPRQPSYPAAGYPQGQLPDQPAQQQSYGAGYPQGQVQQQSYGVGYAQGQGQPQQQPYGAGYAQGQGQPQQQPYGAGYPQGQVQQQPYGAAYAQGLPYAQPGSYAPPAQQAYGQPGFYVPPAQQAATLKPSQRIRPNGKHYFSARTIVYPITFVIVHFIIQLVAGVLAAFSYLGNHPLSSLTDMTPEMMQEMAVSVAIPLLLYSTPVQIIVYVIFLWYQKRKDRQYLLMRPSHMAAFPLSIGASFGGLGIATLLITLFEMLASNSPFWQSMLGNYEQSNAGLQDANLLLLTLGVVILIPFAEELLFRGIVTEEFRRVAPDWLAIVLGGIIFALVHGNLVQILYVLPLGLLLGAAYIWTNSIWSPILIHVVFNFFGSVFGLLIGENETVRTIYTIFLMVMIPVGILCTVIMYRMFRKNKGKKEPAGEVIGK